MTTPIVSVVIPARNEINDIEACLESVAKQDYPLELIEVLVIDGASSDGTPERAKELLTAYGFGGAAVLSNPVATTPTNLNMGLAAAAGRYLCRVDARSRIPVNYVRRCIAVMETSDDIAVVGGSQVSASPAADPVPVGIARALNNRWSMGGSRYRRQSVSGSCETVYLGFFRTAQVRAEAGWDESLPTNQDFDLNRRMSAHGVVWFEAGLPVAYIPRPDLGRLWRQYVRFGRWKVRYWRRGADKPQPRQLALIAVTPAGFALVALTACFAPRWLKWLPLAGAAAVAGIEVAGADEPDGGVAAHAAGAVAMAAVTGGWSFGVWRELLRPTQNLAGHDSK